MIQYLSTIGNKKSNQFWNPKREPFPYDDDDKDEIYQFLRNKYIKGKYRYDEIDPADYNLGGKYRSRSKSSSRPRSRSNAERENSRRIPLLTNVDVPEIERFKYRKLERQLQNLGYTNTENNFESLKLANGDINFAIDILINHQEEKDKPALPARPGTASSTANLSSNPTGANFWNTSNPQPSVFDGTSAPTTANTTAASAAVTGGGLIAPPQQFLDPATGIIYVDPVQQQKYLEQQQLLQQQQAQQQFQQQPVQQQQTSGIFYQQPAQAPQQTAIFQQKTGVDKNQLLSLYSQPQQQAQFNPYQQQYQQPPPQYQPGYNPF